MGPSLALLLQPPSSCPPSGAWDNDRILGNQSPCPEAPPCLQSHSMGLLSHLSQSFLKTPGYFRSEDGHLLAHPGVPHRTCIQTGIPAQGGSQSKRDTTHTHRTQTQGGWHLQGTQMVRGATGQGIQRVQALSFWASWWGRERRAGHSPEWPSRKQRDPGGACRRKRTPEGSGLRHREGGRISQCSLG